MESRSNAIPPKMSTARTKITDAIGFLSSKWRILGYLAQNSEIISDMETNDLVVDGLFEKS